MARYSISYTCGHEGDVNLIGHHRSRERRIAYLKSGECFDCYKQHATESAHAQAEELELPALLGTEKQIAWAEKLRIQKLTELETDIEKLEGSPNIRQILIAAEKINNETSAKQWIEWRFDPPLCILNRVLKTLLAAPTEEQKRAEREAREQADALRRAAQVEATLRPEAPISSLAAEIRVVKQTISVLFPERRDDFCEIVKALHYTWMNGSWQREIGTLAGTPIDRVVELGQALLAHGFLVRAFDETLRANIVSGVFEPEQTRRISRLVEGPYSGWLMIRWSHNEDYYEAARKIESSKYWSPFVVVPPTSFEQIRDFAQMYQFYLSKGAQETLRKAQEDKEQMLLVSAPSIARREQMILIGDKPPVLAVPDVMIADELRDN